MRKLDLSRLIHVVRFVTGDGLAPPARPEIPIDVALAQRLTHEIDGEVLERAVGNDHDLAKARICGEPDLARHGGRSLVLNQAEQDARLAHAVGADQDIDVMGQRRVSLELQLQCRNLVEHVTEAEVDIRDLHRLFDEQLPDVREGLYGPALTLE